MIEFKHVTKSYGRNDALTDINLTIHEGELIFIQGHSGAGKSTLLKLIARIETASLGQVFFGKQNLKELTQNAVPFYRRKLGLIFQDPHLIPNRTIFDNVALPLLINGFYDMDIEKRVLAALNRVGLLNKAQAYPLMLSGGEQQRVSIARAIVHKPRIILADEPTGNLDPALSFEIMKLFERFHQVGATVVVASHDEALLSRFNHRKIVLDQGKCITPETTEHEEMSYV